VLQRVVSLGPLQALAAKIVAAANTERQRRREVRDGIRDPDRRRFRAGGCARGLSFA
jgi:hypothetical protein